MNSATALFAGSIQGVAQTLTSAIYSEFAATNMDAALAMSAVLAAVSFGVLVGSKTLLKWRDWA